MRRLARTTVSLVTLALSSALLVGCGGGTKKLEKQVASLQDELAELQGDYDMISDRLTGLEAQVQAGALRGAADSATADAEPGAERIERPRLKVIRVGPGSSAAPPAHPPSEDPAESEGTRPVIRGSGDKAQIIEGRPTSRVDDAPHSRSGKPAPAPRGAVQEYEAALELVRAGELERAEAALNGFLERHPRHPHADNALYWRGECHYARGRYEQASADFLAVLERYPAGNKVPDALLKLGMAQAHRGALHEARATFERLSQNFPRAAAAAKIPSI